MRLDSILSRGSLDPFISGDMFSFLRRLFSLELVRGAVSSILYRDGGLHVLVLFLLMSLVKFGVPGTIGDVSPESYTFVYIFYLISGIQVQ